MSNIRVPLHTYDEQVYTQYGKAKVIPNLKSTNTTVSSNTSTVDNTTSLNDLGSVFTHFDEEQEINVPTENELPKHNKIIRPRKKGENQ